MSTFKVEVRTVRSTIPHPNADKLDLVYLNGMDYQFISGRGNFSEKQKVVYFPVDAVLPDDLASRLGLPKARIRAVRLRGSFSEGFLAPLEQVGLDEKLAWDQQDLTESLGVVKYEPPAVYGQWGAVSSKPENLIAPPVYVHHYDIENAGRYPNAVEVLLDQQVFISEKLEGSHWWASSGNGEGRFHVGTRNNELKDDDTHPWWKVFRKQRLYDVLNYLWLIYKQPVTIRGEVIGEAVQGNIYGLKGQEVRLFEVEVSGIPVDVNQFLYIMTNTRALHVPILNTALTLREWLNGRTLTDASHGKSQIADTLREGIVIKPMKEQYHPEIGRLFIKVRDPIYLAGDKS